MRLVDIEGNRFYNGDSIEGCRKHIQDGSVDLIITDPPYGINGDELHKHYNRNENHVVDGYIEVSKEKYGKFSHDWISEAARILRPNGSLYIISGYTNLYHILDALRATNLIEVNHIIWKYNFGVHTRRKYVSSHYHILYYEKPGPEKRIFNLKSRYGIQERDPEGGSLNYQDREDVWKINREYKPGIKKNKNELPTTLLTKMIQYSSNESDIVCDLFMGGFSTAYVSIGLGRIFVGFELSESIFQEKISDMESIESGYLLQTLRSPEDDCLFAQGKPWRKAEIQSLTSRYSDLVSKNHTKASAIQSLSIEFGRGRFAIERIIKNKTIKVEDEQPTIPDITKY